MPVRLVVMDLDDTLLGSDLTISERNKKVINQACQEGVLVTVATGRMPLSCRRFVEQIPIEIPVIMCHGAIVKDTAGGGEVIFRRVIEKSLAAEAINKMQMEGMHCQIYLKDKIYTNQCNKWAENWRQLSRLQAEEADLLEILAQEGEGAEKIVSIDEEDIIADRYNTFKTLFQGKIHLTMSKPNFLEMSAADVNKGAALAFLAERHGIAREEIMAIGDSLNDIEMIQYAGIGVVMGNGRPETKRAADYITASNDEDGVAQAIEKFVLARSQ